MVCLACCKTHVKTGFQIILLTGLLSFLGCKEKTESSIASTTLELDDSTKEKLRNELKRDSNRPFDSEWIRTTNLERTIVDKYGFEGIKLVFEYRNSKNYYDKGSFPSDCPWYSLNSLSIKESIEKNFEPIRAKLPLLINSLKDRCEFIYAEKKNQDWHLHYFLRMKLYNGGNYYRIYTGGPPKNNIKPNSNLQSFQWEIPNDLKEFYSIHDGFGEIYDANFILSSKNIEVMGERMNPIVKKLGVTPEDYSFNDLLEFFPDGIGNTQCFIRSKKDNIKTVDWDHEVWKISNVIGFYDFINERMSEIDEE